MRGIGLAVMIAFCCSWLTGSRVLAQPEQYRIGPGDRLSITVCMNETLSRSVEVFPDGKISLPLLNGVQAAGLTATELRNVLTERLQQFLPRPEVAVILTEIRSLKSVLVIGAESVSLHLDPARCVTALEALGRARARLVEKGSRIIILRPEGASTKRIPLDYNKLAGGEQENFCLHQGDIVIVP
jgi:polysaccharide biosynthesis/export protein